MSSSLHIGPSMETVRDKAISQVDNEAEIARLRWMTPGVGQALEYQLSEQEAGFWLGLRGDPADYPFLAAEADARGVTMDEAAADIAQKAKAFREALASIKHLRRAAKEAIKNASSVGQIRKATSVSWP